MINIKKIGLVFCCIILMLASGCDFKDIDRRRFIVAIGLELGSDKNKIKVSCKSALPFEKGAAAPEKKYVLYTAETDSISEALRIIKTKAAFEPDYGHMKMVILSQEFAEKHGLKDTVDFFVRRRDMQNIAWFAIGRPSIKEFLDFQPEGEMIAGNYLFLKFGQGVESPYAYKKTTAEMYTDIMTSGFTPTCPIVRVEKPFFVLENTAIFSKDKIAMELTRDETMIFNILDDQINDAYIKIYPKDNETPVGISLNRISRKIDIVLEEDGVVCNVEVKGGGVIEETYLNDHDLKMFGELTSKEIKKNVEGLLNKLKEKNLDPLLIQKKYWMKKRDYNFSEAWLIDIYPKMKFKVNVDVDVNTTGSLK